MKSSYLAVTRTHADLVEYRDIIFVIVFVMQIIYHCDLIDHNYKDTNIHWMANHR